MERTEKRNTIIMRTPRKILARARIREAGGDSVQASRPDHGEITAETILSMKQCMVLGDFG